MEAHSKGRDWMYGIVVAGLLLSIAILYLNVLTPTREGTVTNKEFPSVIEDWIGREVLYDERTLGVLEADKIIYKRYDTKQTASITLFIAYYETIEKSDMSHSPVVCFTGQGWTIEESGKATIPVERSKGQWITVNEMLLKKDAQYMLTLYWYQAGSQVFTNRGLQKLALFFRKLLSKEDENTFVRVTLVLPDLRSIEKKRREICAFTEQLYPEICRLML